MKPLFDAATNQEANYHGKKISEITLNPVSHEIVKKFTLNRLNALLLIFPFGSSSDNTRRRTASLDMPILPGAIDGHCKNKKFIN